MCYENRTKAFAKIKGGNLYPDIRGVIFFDEADGGTEVCEITNPNNPFESAGGHYNPTDQPHGNHAGDFPVLFSNDGYARMRFFTDKFNSTDIIGRSVIIHRGWARILPLQELVLSGGGIAFIFSLNGVY